MSEIIGKGKVYIVEDDESFAALIKTILASHNNQVVGEAFWAFAAIAEIDNFEQLGVNIITLDRDLRNADMATNEFVSKVRTDYPNIKIVGMSCCAMPKGLVNVDLGKGNVTLLNNVINGLLWDS